MNFDPSAVAVVIPAWKRALDLSGCVLALPVLAMVSLIVAVLTALVSRGPIFYRQERVGYRGRRFKLFKFRTMHPTADPANHQAHFAELIRHRVPMQKMDTGGDSRLFTGGRLLRASGLDELPQILNVLRGEMSLVGPRPCIPYECEHFLPRHQERFEAAPGLTGLWQVSGKNRTTFEEMVQLDIDYVRRLSLGRDLKIILMTVPTVCRQIFDWWNTKQVERAKSIVRSPRSIHPA